MGALGVDPHACVHFFCCSWLLQSASSVKARIVKKLRDRELIKEKKIATAS